MRHPPPNLRPSSADRRISAALRAVVRRENPPPNQALEATAPRCRFVAMMTFRLFPEFRRGAYGRRASPPVRLRREQGLERVMADLREFPSREIAHRLVPDTSSPLGRREAKARRESLPVVVRLLPSDAIEFTPCARWSRSAWTHLPDRAVVLQQPTTRLTFFQALSDAFDRCIQEPV